MDKIYFFYKNFKINKFNNKLNYIKFNLFLIKEYKENINYILKLLKLIKKYNIFYILLLEKIDFKILL